MTVEPLVPDVPAMSQAPPAVDGKAFSQALDAVGSTLSSAAAAEDAFAAGGGSLERAVYERARADVAIAVASAAATHCVQSLQSILGMQI